MLDQAGTAEPVALHAFALLETEVRLLATPQQPQSLGRWVQAVGRRYVSAHNRRHHRQGTLWSGRYRCAVMEPGPSRLAALQWVDGQPGAGALTSADHRLGGSRRAGLSDPPEYWVLGNTPFEREAAYRQLLQRGLPLALANDLRRAAMGGWAWGSDGFAAETALAASRPSRPRARGRTPRQA